jgi:D-threo-aldose 1-dehydrogenase
MDRLRATKPFGFGASSLGNLYRKIDEQQALATFDAAWNAGIRYFDTAPFYGSGLSERRLGDALRGHDRDSYLLSTKVGRLLKPIPRAHDANGFLSPLPFEPVYDYSFDGVMRSVEDSLQRLGLSHVDILYIHDVGRSTHGGRANAMFVEAMDHGYRALDRLRCEGVVKAIGLGVNEWEVCSASFSHADFDLFLIAGRYTLLDQSALSFFDQCAARGIGIVAAGVFNSGILATGANSTGPVLFDYSVAPDEIVARVDRLEALCARFEVPLAAAAQQIATAHPAVMCSLIGAAQAVEIEQAVRNSRYAIPDAFWDALLEQSLLDPKMPLPRQQVATKQSNMKGGL